MSRRIVGVKATVLSPLFLVKQIWLSLYLLIPYGAFVAFEYWRYEQVVSIFERFTSDAQAVIPLLHLSRISMGIRFGLSFLLTFFSLAFIFHTAAAMKHQKTGMMAGLKASAQNIVTIFLWTLITSATAYFLTYTSTILYKPFLKLIASLSIPYLTPRIIKQLVTSPFALIWELATFLVLPLIILTRKNILRTLGISGSMALKNIFAIIIGTCVILLFSTPIALLMLRNIKPTITPALVRIALTKGAIFIQIALFLIFKTKLYLQSSQQETPSPTGSPEQPAA